MPVSSSMSAEAATLFWRLSQETAASFARTAASNVPPCKPGLLVAQKAPKVSNDSASGFPRVPPNNSFKPKTNRCAIVFGLIQALGGTPALLPIPTITETCHG